LSSLASRTLAPRRRTLLDLLLLTLLCLLFFWRDLPWAGVDYRGFASGDFGYQFYAFASYKAARLHAGQLPLWSPYALGGHPFLADIQSAVFYPPGLLTMLVTALTGFSYQALQLEAILHLPVAAIGMYLLALRLTDSRIGAWVAACAFTFSAYLTGYPMLQLAILETVAWTPLILLALDHAVAALAPRTGRSWVGWTLLAGLFMGMALLAGHPQSGMFVFYGSISFALFRYFTRAKEPGRRPLRPIAAALALFAVSAAGIAAAQLLPSLEYLRLSTRTGLGIDAAGGGFTPYDLLQFVLPQVAAPVAALYIGVVPFGLALYALTRARTRSSSMAGLKDRGLAYYFGGLTLAGLLLSFGALTPVYQLAYLVVPGWRLFRQQERIAVWVVFGLAMLAGLAAAALARRGKPAADGAPSPAEESGGPGGLLIGYWVAAAGAALFALGCFMGYVAGNEGLWAFATAGLFLALILALAPLTLRTRQPVWLIALIVVDLFAVIGRQHAGDAATALVFPPAPVVEAVKADGSIYRTADESVMPGNYGYGYGLRDTNGASPLRLASYDRVATSAPKPLFWQLLGIKYVFTWRSELEAPATRIAEQTGKNGSPLYAYRLAATNPLAWFAGEALVEPDAGRQQERVLSQGFDPHRQVVLDRAPAPQPQPGCTGSADWLVRTPEFLSLHVASDGPCILVLSEIAYPGWDATIDGAAAPVLTADAILRGIAVPGGEHQVELTFRPRSLIAGLLMSGVTVLAVLAALFWVSRTRSGESDN
jgi:hypothetical protein